MSVNKNKDPRYPNDPKLGMITLTDTSAGQLEFSADSGDVYIEWINVVTDADESANYLTFEVVDNSDVTVSMLGQWDMTTNCGISGIAPEDIKTKMSFLDVDGAGNKILRIPAGYKLQVTASAVSGTNIDISVGYSHYAED